jgi:hypothetical protein
MCSLIKRHKVFAACQTVVDPSPYVDACKYDLCADANVVHRDTYRCRAVAQYAQECAHKGIHVDWMEEDDLADLRSACLNSNYGKCHGGALYHECAPKQNTTCRELSYQPIDKLANHHYKDVGCVAGCACPEGQYYENTNGNLQCVEKKSCSCYDPLTRKNKQRGATIKKGCSTW